MFLHIGNGVSIRKKDIVGIFDLDTSTVSKITKDFINKNNSKVTYTDTDLPRAFILTDDGGDFGIRLSRISTLGLKQRADSEISEE